MPLPPKLAPIAIRLSQVEQASWRAAAAAGQMTLSDFVRDAVQVAHPEVSAGAPAPIVRRRVEPSRADPELIAQLSRIGNNLNQLARIANTQQDALGVLVVLRSLEGELTAALRRCC